MVTALGKVKMGARRHYYDFLNFFMRRVVAVSFIAGGAIMGITGIGYLLPGATVLVNGSPSRDLLLRLFAALMPWVMAGLGVLLYRVAPYYPKDTFK